MIKQFFAATVLTTFALAASAVEVGEKLPAVEVSDKGELVLKGDKVKYRDWSTTNIEANKPALLFHLAARMSAQKVVDPVTAALEARQLDKTKHTALTVVNLNDAMWGTAGIVAGELQKNKKKHPEARIMADDNGSARRAWDLDRGETYFILLDANQNVIHKHEGAMSADEIKAFVDMLAAEIDKV